MKEEDRLDAEILASFERDEWRSALHKPADLDRYAAYAAGSLGKDKRVNIRISSLDLEGIQAQAAQEGLPYQTLMSSVLHKYVTGRLVDASQASTVKRSKRRAG
jgi:predicted DNA binding CopG/RHH family protein